MKVSMWIVTYQNPEDLHNNLQTLFANSTPDFWNLEVNVINNHSNYKLNSCWWGKVTTWHNCMRHDQSLGHLARNWNQALQLGFDSLATPKNDLVICAQDDVLWQPQWQKQVTEAVNTYSLITQGVGDAVMVYKPEAVRKIGMWDERFAPSFYHDGDYLLRALMYNKPHSSINDPAHGRVLNPLHTSFATVPVANSTRVNAKNLSYGKAALPHKVWQRKWDVSPIHWTPELMDTPPEGSKCVNYITYPHFEQHVEDLQNKNYLI